MSRKMTGQIIGKNIVKSQQLFDGLDVLDLLVAQRRRLFLDTQKSLGNIAIEFMNFSRGL